MHLGLVLVLLLAFPSLTIISDLSTIGILMYFGY